MDKPVLEGILFNILSLGELRLDLDIMLKSDALTEFDRDVCVMAILEPATVVLLGVDVTEDNILVIEESNSGRGDGQDTMFGVGG